MKCLIKGCNEHDAIDGGEWLCPHCFVMVVTGFVGEGKTFIHDLKNELLVASAMVEKLSIIAAQAIDGGGAANLGFIKDDGKGDDDLVTQLRR
jgi:hypothetical protein